MNDDCCFYLKVVSRLGKALLRNAFIDGLRMEFVGDVVYQIEMFACSESLFEEDDYAVCYFQCENVVGCDLLKEFVKTILITDQYVICRPSRYCCDHVSSKGFCIWHI